MGSEIFLLLPPSLPFCHSPKILWQTAGESPAMEDERESQHQWKTRTVGQNQWKTMNPKVKSMEVSHFPPFFFFLCYGGCRAGGLAGEGAPAPWRGGARHQLLETNRKASPIHGHQFLIYFITKRFINGSFLFSFMIFFIIFNQPMSSRRRERWDWPPRACRWFIPSHPFNGKEDHDDNFLYPLIKSFS